MTTKALHWGMPLGFFVFIAYIIFLADTADYNFAFRLIGHIPYGDKLAHALLYGIMALLLSKALPKHPYLGAVIVLIFALLEECSQYYIPSRTFDLGDLVADFVGILGFCYWGRER